MISSWFSGRLRRNVQAIVGFLMIHFRFRFCGFLAIWAGDFILPKSGIFVLIGVILQMVMRNACTCNAADFHIEENTTSYAFDHLTSFSIGTIQPQLSTLKSY